MLRLSYLQHRRQDLTDRPQFDRVMSFIVEEQKPNLGVIPLPAPPSMSFSSVDANRLHHEQRSISISGGQSSSTQMRKRGTEESCDARRNAAEKWRKHTFGTIDHGRHSSIEDHRRRDLPTSIRFDGMTSYFVDYSGREPSLTIVPLLTWPSASNIFAGTSNVGHEQNLRNQAAPVSKNGVPTTTDASQDGTFDWIVPFIQSVELKMRQLSHERQNVIMRKITDIVFEE